MKKEKKVFYTRNLWTSEEWEKYFNDPTGFVILCISKREVESEKDIWKSIKNPHFKVTIEVLK